MHALVALDDTEPSWDAAEFAGALLGPDDDVTVINVVSTSEPVRIAAGGLTGLPAMSGGQGVGDVHVDVLDTLRPAIAAANADSIVIEEGDVVNRICSVAEDLGVDMIVVGTRDQNAVMRFLTGSVSTRLVHEAPCPVVVVR